jgi:hypothetical protein
MIRFRHADDEKHYIALRSELFRVIASRLPPEHATAAMRDLGKLEGLLYYEGVRQGLACAAVGLAVEMPGIEKMKYPQVIASIYGAADTPLIDAEKEQLEQLEPADRERLMQHSWLTATPMKYAPSTYADFMGMKEPPRPMIRVNAPGPPVPITPEMQKAREDLAASFGPDSIPTPDEAAAIRKEWEREPREPTPADIAKLSAMFEEEDALGPPPHSPELVERARDAISVMIKAGYKAQSWPGFVLALHRETGMDAAVLDLVLSGPQGLTMLEQMHVNVRPGASISVDDLAATEGPLVTDPAR